MVEGTEPAKGAWLYSHRERQRLETAVVEWVFTVVAGALVLTLLIPLFEDQASDGFGTLPWLRLRAVAFEDGTELGSLSGPLVTLMGHGVTVVLVVVSLSALALLVHAAQAAGHICEPGSMFPESLWAHVTGKLRLWPAWVDRALGILLLWSVVFTVVLTFMISGEGAGSRSAPWQRSGIETSTGWWVFIVSALTAAYLLSASAGTRLGGTWRATPDPPTSGTPL